MHFSEFIPVVSMAVFLIQLLAGILVIIFIAVSSVSGVSVCYCRWKLLTGRYTTVSVPFVITEKWIGQSLLEDSRNVIRSLMKNICKIEMTMFSEFLLHSIVVNPYAIFYLRLETNPLNWAVMVLKEMQLSLFIFSISLSSTLYLKYS